MKIALQFRFNRGERARTRFVAFEHAYHGDTFAAMSVCDPEEGMHRLFGEALARAGRRAATGRPTRARRVSSGWSPRTRPS